MSRIDSSRDKSRKKGKRRKHTKSYTAPTRKEIKIALNEFLANGGEITKIEPIWIEEGELYIFE